MYKEGRQIIVDAKKEIDGVIKDVKEVKKTANGLFGFLTSIFNKKEVVEPKHDLAPVKKKKKETPPEFDENLIYAQVAEASARRLDVQTCQA